MGRLVGRQILVIVVGGDGYGFMLMLAKTNRYRRRCRRLWGVSLLPASQSVVQSLVDWQANTKQGKQPPKLVCLSVSQLASQPVSAATRRLKSCFDDFVWIFLWVLWSLCGALFGGLFVQWLQLFSVVCQTRLAKSVSLLTLRFFFCFLLHWSLCCSVFIFGLLTWYLTFFRCRKAEVEEKILNYGRLKEVDFAEKTPDRTESKQTFDK